MKTPSRAPSGPSARRRSVAARRCAYSRTRGSRGRRAASLPPLRPRPVAYGVRMNEFDRVGALAMRHLVAFETVAEERSFTRAARRLGYTQSAVSHQMATLERLVGKHLIERPRGTEAANLTEAGEILHRHARALISRVKLAYDDLDGLAEGVGGTFRFGTYQSARRTSIPPRLIGAGTSKSSSATLTACSTSSATCFSSPRSRPASWRSSGRRSILAGLPGVHRDFLAGRRRTRDRAHGSPRARSHAPRRPCATRADARQPALNALKFTPKGGRVAVRLQADGGTAVLAVTDTGLGIPADEQGRLFDASSAARRPLGVPSPAPGSVSRLRKRSSSGTAAGSSSRARRASARRSA